MNMGRDEMSCQTLLFFLLRDLANEQHADNISEFHGVKDKLAMDSKSSTVHKILVITLSHGK